MRDRPVDPDEVSDELGAELVRISRRAVEHWFHRRERLPPPDGLPEAAYRTGAAFVTIETYYADGSRDLRGCIGHVTPVKPLVDSVIEVALEAAFNDPRFPPLRMEELDTVTFEVSVLSRLEEAPEDPAGRINFIVIGRDGIVVERGAYRGLLLPEVPVEYLWDVQTFLSEGCLKAGLWPDCWLDPSTRVYRFRTRLWREERPKGPVSRRDLAAELRAKLGDEKAL